MKFFPKVVMMFTLVIAIMCIGCYVPMAPQASYNIHPDRVLNAYKYVYILPLEYDDGSHDKYGIANKVDQILRQEGFNTIDEFRLKKLNKEDMLELLFCSVKHWHTPAGAGTAANVEISFTDITLETVYFGIGVFQGHTIQEDLFGATEQALGGLVTVYTGFDLHQKFDPSDKFADWETIECDKQTITLYLDNYYNDLDPIEGIWTSMNDNQYRIGIFKDTLNVKRDFVAVVLETENYLWKPNQVKMEFEKTAYPKVYTTTYYMADHSRQGITSFINDVGLLQLELNSTVDDTKIESSFIKNYPSNIGVDLSGESTNSINNGGLSSGSGFIISNTGLVVTNYHVIQDKEKINIYFPSIDESVKVSVAIKDKTNDIAILSIDDFANIKTRLPNVPFVLSNMTNLKIGQEVFTLGFPLGDVLGKSAKLSTGTVNSLFGIQDDPRLFQISNPIQPGNSGGPLFNKNGEIVGIIVATLNAKYFYENESIIPQNVNFAIKSNYLSNLVSMLPEEEKILKRENVLLGKSFEEQIDLITPFVVTITAE